ncbi:MAG: TrmB family transcriptional regulator [Halobacteria archaeon]
MTEEIFETLDLKEYEETALKETLSMGRTTAPNLADATGIPKARIYGVLDQLADRGFIKIIPGRPKKYQPKPPEEILETARENLRQEYRQAEARIEENRGEFLDKYRPIYETGSQDITPTEELFHVVDVGNPSEKETRRIYRKADEKIRVLTKAFEYIDEVKTGIVDAAERDIDFKVLYVHPRNLESRSREVQIETREILDRHGIEYRYSNKPLPWRGTIADPSMDYDTGEAIILVEEKEIPLHMRQAAVTENNSFAAGLGRFFDLVWEHDSQYEP